MWVVAMIPRIATRARITNGQNTQLSKDMIPPKAGDGVISMRPKFNCLTARRSAGRYRASFERKRIEPRFEKSTRVQLTSPG